MTTTRSRAALLAVLLPLIAAVAEARVDERGFAPSSTSTVDGTTVVRGAGFSARVSPVSIDVDLRSVSRARGWRPGDPIRTIPRRRGEPMLHDPRPVNPVERADPLLARQSVRALAGSRRTQISTWLTLDGQASGSNPHDANGDVGPLYFVQAINGPGGTRYTFYDKSDGTIAAGPFTLSDLAADGGVGDTPCATGLGDPIVVFDEIADRWLLTEFSASGNRLCVYVAKSDDPIGGGWWGYDFEAPNFPDYPKYGVWPDAYYVGTNEATSALYALERDAMLKGDPAGQQRFTVVDPAAFAFAMLPPVDHDGGLPPPAGSPGIFIRHFDDEVHEPNNNNPSGDLLQLWELDVDWANAANSTLTGPIDIGIAEIDSDLCGLTSFECFPQPGTATGLDPLREVVMNLPKYRRFSTHESIVGNLVTDVSGADQGGIRWFELRRNGGEWGLFQEGTFAPDVADGAGAVEHRWMGASAMDASGNIALGYNIVNDVNLFPGLRYLARAASDPLGTLGGQERTLIDGGASQTSSFRWGDYASMSVDPLDGCTFWFTSNHGSAATAPTAATRIGAFRIDSCGDPGFTMATSPRSLQACVANGADTLPDVTVGVGSIDGFGEVVELGFGQPLPPGFQAGFTPPSVVPSDPPAESILSIGVDAAAGGGDYALTIAGSAATESRNSPLHVEVADAVPPAIVLFGPAPEATNVDLEPVFEWAASARADHYAFELATDPGFGGGDVVVATIAEGTAFRPAQPLESATTYFWRVTPVNQCGAGVASSGSFTTELAAGECSSATFETTYFFDDVESGANGWTVETAIGDDSWMRQSAQANSPVTSWRADSVDDVSDQRLISPAIHVPAVATAPTLEFFSDHDLERDSEDRCWDAGIVEFSTDDGQSWSAFAAADILTNAYTGVVNSGSSSPIAGLPGWCGAQAWRRTVVDLGGLQDATLRFRFRLVTDVAIAAGDWLVDDITVRGCELDVLFADGFE